MAQELMAAAASPCTAGPRSCNTAHRPIWGRLSKHGGVDAPDELHVIDCVAAVLAGGAGGEIWAMQLRPLARSQQRLSLDHRAFGQMRPMLNTRSHP